MILLCLLVIGYVDYATGYELSFSMFYLIPLLLAVWYLGGRATIFMVPACTLVWLWADWASGHPYTSDGLRIWRTGMHLIFFSIIAIGGSRERRRAELKVDEIEREHAIERERTRIARDIHDEIGAGLTEIALLSELARDATNLERDQYLGDIFSKARNLSQSFEEIVWAINPANDTLERLISYLIEFTQDFLGAAGLACRLDVPTNLPPLMVPATVRHQMCLVVKESLNNIVKHAAAFEVHLRIEQSDGKLLIVIKDNGCGFHRGELNGRHGTGNGLVNLESRIRDVAGSLEVESAPGLGTRIRLSVKLPTPRQ